MWQTKSHAIIPNSSTPPDCIERMISQRGEVTMFQRFSTPRSASRICHEQQQHAAASSSQHFRSCGKLQQDRHDGEHEIVQEVARNCSKHNIVKEGDSFQVDLRVPGVSQDVIYQDEGRTTELRTFCRQVARWISFQVHPRRLETRRIEYVNKALKRTIKEMGNIELYELGETDRTTQCPTCFRHSNEGTV